MSSRASTHWAMVCLRLASMLDSRVNEGIGIEAQLNRAGGLGRLLAERGQASYVSVRGDHQDVSTEARAPHREQPQTSILGGPHRLPAVRGASTALPLALALSMGDDNESPTGPMTGHQEDLVS